MPDKKVTPTNTELARMWTTDEILRLVQPVRLLQEQNTVGIHGLTELRKQDIAAEQVYHESVAKLFQDAGNHINALKQMVGIFAEKADALAARVTLLEAEADEVEETEQEQEKEPG